MNLAQFLPTRRSPRPLMANSHILRVAIIKAATTIIEVLSTEHSIHRLWLVTLRRAMRRAVAVALPEEWAAAPARISPEEGAIHGMASKRCLTARVREVNTHVLDVPRRF